MNQYSAIVQLGDLMLERGGSTDPSKHSSTSFALYSIPAFDAGSPEFVLGAAIGSSKKNVEPGDVLVSRIVPHIRRAWIVEEHDEPIIASGEWIVFRDRRIHPNYLRHFLISDLFHKQFMMTVAGVGGSLLRARPADVARIDIHLPPLDEQRRIAAILDKADALRQKRKRAIALLDSLTQSIFLAMFGDVASNPLRFPMGSLSDVCHFKGGAQPPKSVFSDTNGSDKIRLIQIRDYKSDRYITYIPSSTAKRFCSSSDVMIGRYGPPVFQILRGLEGSYNVALMKAVPRSGFQNEFLFWLLSTQKIQSDVIGQSQRTAGQSGVNLDYLNGYPVYLPPQKLQVEFEERMSAVTRLHGNLAASQEHNDTAFASLQHRAFSGQL